MASLLVLKGGNPGQRLPLDKPTIVLGREAKDCDYVIPNQAVSRVHAQISLIQDRHYIEDLKSRNKTYVNNKLVDTRTLLSDNDRIKICDFLCTYHIDSQSKAPLPDHLRSDAPEEPAAEGPSTVQATIQRLPTEKLLEATPPERLRALLEISTVFGSTLQLDALLEKVSDILLTTFRQADRCFIILHDEPTKTMIPKVVKLRRGQSDGSPRFSRTIVRNALESGKAFLSEDATSDTKFSLSQSITDFRILSVMVAPLTRGEKPIGVIQLDSQDRSKKFTEDDLKLLMAVANQASVALENARLHEDLIYRERTQRDLELGKQVQNSFLPQGLPQILGYQFFAAYNSALTIGGDYYDFIPLRDGRLGVLLGDVAGKGVPAALLMAKLSAEARYCVLTNDDPAKAVGCLNEILLSAGTMDRFVTLAATVLNPDTHRVTVVNAGHMTPLIFRKAKWEFEDAIADRLTGLPLGILEENTYDSWEVELYPGDVLMLYTDGVTDALSAQNKPFGMDGIRKAILDDPALDSPHRPEDIGKALLAAVRKHAAGRDQNDDIAIVCYGRLDQASSSVSTLSGTDHAAQAAGPDSHSERPSHGTHP